MWLLAETVPFAYRLPFRIFIEQRALPTETKDESGTSQSKSGTSVNLSTSGDSEEQVSTLVPVHFALTAVADGPLPGRYNAVCAGPVGLRRLLPVLIDHVLSPTSVRV